MFFISSLKDLVWRNWLNQHFLSEFHITKPSYTQVLLWHYLPLYIQQVFLWQYGPHLYTPMHLNLLLNNVLIKGFVSYDFITLQIAPSFHFILHCHIFPNQLVYASYCTCSFVRSWEIYICVTVLAPLFVINWALYLSYYTRSFVIQIMGSICSLLYPLFCHIVSSICILLNLLLCFSYCGQYLGVTVPAPLLFRLWRRWGEAPAPGGEGVTRRRWSVSLSSIPGLCMCSLHPTSDTILSVEVILLRHICEQYMYFTTKYSHLV